LHIGKLVKAKKLAKEAELAQWEKRRAIEVGLVEQINALAARIDQFKLHQGREAGYEQNSSLSDLCRISIGLTPTCVRKIVENVRRLA